MTGSLALLSAGPSSPSSFSPLTLSPAAWYDFSQLGLADGTAIQTVTDLSGNGRDITQATVGLRPLAKTAIQNGKDVGRFDGADDYLQSAVQTMNQPLTWFVVCRYRAAFAATDAIFDGGFGGGSAFKQYLSRHSATDMEMYAGAALAIPGTTPQNWHVWTATFNGASSECRVDGSVAATGDAGATNSGGVTIGAAANGAQPGAIDVGELIACAPPSVANRQATEAFLKAKWGTP